VEERCTCGTVMVEGARFCHRCGRPSGGIEPTPEAEPEAPAVVAAPAAPAVTVVAGGFHDSAALRVALIAALLTFLLSVALGPLAAFNVAQFFVQIILLAGGGFYAVYLYRRRTGVHLNPRAGARVGWITGLFNFVIGLVLLTLLMLAVSSQGGIDAVLDESKTGVQVPPELLKSMHELFSNTGRLTVSVFSFFLTATMAASIGGMLGAKVLEKD